MTATPAAAAAPGHVVRVRVGGGLCYTSPRLTADEATALADQITNAVTLVAGSWRFIEFVDGTLGLVRVRAQRVTAIEGRPVGVPA
ncbi:hypothetical protein TEK04_19445 [Klenkia sp. LSe6-5]|uniref:Uncharacterized protein n=1 Tax=Klenkia sesuvii TaxID=3103137 RepID=A0ABU8DZF5_9ACTN